MVDSLSESVQAREKAGAEVTMQDRASLATLRLTLTKAKAEARLLTPRQELAPKYGIRSAREMLQSRSLDTRTHDGKKVTYMSAEDLQESIARREAEERRIAESKAEEDMRIRAEFTQAGGVWTDDQQDAAKEASAALQNQQDLVKAASTASFSSASGSQPPALSPGFRPIAVHKADAEGPPPPPPAGAAPSTDAVGEPPGPPDEMTPSEVQQLQGAVDYWFHSRADLWRQMTPEQADAEFERTWGLEAFYRGERLSPISAIGGESQRKQLGLRYDVAKNAWNNTFRPMVVHAHGRNVSHAAEDGSRASSKLAKASGMTPNDISVMQSDLRRWFQFVTDRQYTLERADQSFEQTWEHGDGNFGSDTEATAQRRATIVCMAPNLAAKNT